MGLTCNMSAFSATVCLSCCRRVTFVWMVCNCVRNLASLPGWTIKGGSFEAPCMQREPTHSALTASAIHWCSIKGRQCRCNADPILESG